MGIFSGATRGPIQGQQEGTDSGATWGSIQGQQGDLFGATWGPIQGQQGDLCHGNKETTVMTTREPFA